jgi:hypothetical protein
LCRFVDEVCEIVDIGRRLRLAALGAPVATSGCLEGTSEPPSMAAHTSEAIILA